MFQYLRKMFFKPTNPRQLQRTVSGLDRHHIESGNYLYRNFSKSDLKKHFEEAAESLKLLNIYGPGSLNRTSIENHTPSRSLIDMLGGGLWSSAQSKTPLPSCQTPYCPSVPSKANSLRPASQKNLSSPPMKSSP